MKRLAEIINRRRTLVSAAALALAVAAIFWFTNSPAIVGAAATTRKLPIYCVRRDDKCISLSFDAAWGNEDTQQLIDIFNEYDISVTFFVVGEWVDKYPESVLALHEAGHEVMNHSDTHAHFASLKGDEIVAELRACNEKVAAVTGVTPTLFRCPYGEYDDHVIAAVESTGMYAVQWDVDSLDWKELSPEETTRRVLTKVSAGSIVLFHNAAKHTPSALPGIIEGLLAEGYTIVPISELLLTGDYEMDHTGRMCPR